MLFLRIYGALLSNLNYHYGSGNTFVLKPSEQDPGLSMLLAELIKEAGVPDGCFNIIHGQHDSVNFICDNPDIKAVSFVGGNRAVS